MSDLAPSPSLPVAPLEAPRVRCAAPLLDRLDALRGELIEQAYALELRGRMEAADVAVGAAARLGELCAEFEPGAETERRANRAPSRRA